MFRVIQRVVRAPLNYLADLRKLSCSSYLLLHTNYSPSYPLMIFTALLSTLALGAFIIYYMLTLPDDVVCFTNVRIGAYIIAVLYPIETILFFICLTGTIALSKNNCWKVVVILLFGPLLSGFGFGQLAFIQMCFMGYYNQNTFNVIQAIKQPAFIDAMIYLYLSFIVLYFVLVPIFEFLYTRQVQDEQQARKSLENIKKSALKAQLDDARLQALTSANQKSCCSRIICILYYVMSFLFAIAVCFILLIKLIGPILYTYIWIQIGSNSQNFSQQNEQVLFALSLLAYFAPLGVTLIALAIQKIVKLARKENDDDNRDSMTINTQGRKTLQLSDGEHRTTKPGPIFSSDNGDNDDHNNGISNSYRKSSIQKEAGNRQTLL